MGRANRPGRALRAGLAAALLTLSALLLLCACGGNHTHRETEAPSGTAPSLEPTEPEATEAGTPALTDEATEPPTEEPTETPTEAPTEAPTEPEEMTMEPKTTLSVIADGRTDYTVRLGEGVADGNATDLAWLWQVMDEKYGTHPAEGEGDGKTVSFLLEGNTRDYALTVDEASGNITVTAGCAATMKKAIQYFATQFCGYSDGDLRIDVDGDYRYVYEEETIDNSSLLSYEGGEKTVLAPSDKDGVLMTPAWLDTAVMVEVRLDTASIGGSFQESYDLIDFYAATGVNVIWLTPIYQRGAGGNGYGNIGLHTVEPALTGTDNMEEGWAVVKEFVDYAHSKGVYILLDIVSWGTMKSAPLLEEHPDWFSGEAWGNAAFNWRNTDFREWYISQAVTNILATGADGYRCDCEPFTAGYEVFAEIRKRLNDQGVYPVIMSEEGGWRKNAFDCEQDGVLDYSKMTRGELYQNPVNFFVDGYLKMVTNTQRGRGLGAANLQSKRYAGAQRYYTNCITNHDYQRRDVCGNRLKIGYAAIYAPYIPLWYMGDEFGAEATKVVLYDRAVDFGLIDSDPEKGIFYEDVKQMLAIRRTYTDIFEYWPLCHRDTNICHVTVDGLDSLENYARFAGDHMILVVANNQEDASGVCTVHIPFADGFTQDYANYRVTDLLTGRVITVGRADTVDGFSAVVPYQYCGVFLVEGIPAQ